MVKRVIRFLIFLFFICISTMTLAQTLKVPDLVKKYGSTLNMDFFNELTKYKGYLSYSVRGGDDLESEKFSESFYFFPDVKYIDSMQEKVKVEGRKERINGSEFSLLTGYYYIKKTKSCIYAIKNYEYEGGEYSSAKPVECPEWVLKEAIPRDPSLEFTRAGYVKYFSKCFKSDDVRSCLRVLLEPNIDLSATPSSAIPQSRNYLLNIMITDEIVECLKQANVENFERRGINCPYKKGDTRMKKVGISFDYVDSDFNQSRHSKEEIAKKKVYISTFSIYSCILSETDPYATEEWCGPNYKLIK